MLDVDVDIYHGMVVLIPYTIEHINIQDPYHTISYHILPYHTISYHIIPYHIISHRTYVEFEWLLNVDVDCW